jgi:hypothetical protein
MLSRQELQQVDPYLTKISIEYANRPDAYIATQALPIINTEGKTTGRYRKFKKGNMFRKYDDARARLSRSSKVHVEMDTDGTFACIQRALHDGIDDRDAKEFMSQGLDLQEFAVRIVTDAVLLGREYRVASLLTSASVLTNYAGLTGNDMWDVYTSASSDPWDDVETMRNSIHANTGAEMNIIIIGRQVYNKLRNHPAIIDRIKYTMGIQDGKVTPQLLAAAFDVEKVLIGNPLYQTTKEGQTETLGYIWGKNVIGAFVDQAPTNRSRTLGFIPSLYGSNAVQMAKWYEQSVKGTFVEGTIDEDEIIVDANCAYLLQTVVT